MENKNKEFGELLANLLYENGINYCPFILNSEQANALYKRYKELHKKKIWKIKYVHVVKQKLHISQLKPMNYI